MASNEVTTRTPASSAVAANLKKPGSMLHTAVELSRFIKENKLCSNIQGKDYVQVEGWQFAGSSLGIIPRMGLVQDLSTDTEIRFRATVTLYDLHNKVEVGGGVAECSNKERTKKFYESYAICSMAQTRAVGKAYRNCLAWLIKAAGFEATPFEEMMDVADAGTGAQVVQEPAEPQAPRPTPAAPAPVASAPASLPPVAPATAALSSAAPAKEPNEDAFLFMEVAVAIDSIDEAETLEGLAQVWAGLDRQVKEELDVYDAKESRKAHLQANLTLSHAR